jgi:CHRD domain-containing protein
MKPRTRVWTAIAAIGAATLVGAASTGSAAADDFQVQNIVFERLTGYQEDPLAFSTPGTATFFGTINDHDQKIDYRLAWKDLPTNVVQAHIHLGGRAQSGGVIVFLCGGGPATNPAPACPAGDATVTGTITPDSVIGPAGQGITAGEFAELLAAIRAGATYVNIHTTERPGGEIRGQIDRH